MGIIDYIKQKNTKRKRHIGEMQFIMVVLNIVGLMGFGDLFLRKHTHIFHTRSYQRFTQNWNVMKKSYRISWIKWNKIF